MPFSEVAQSKQFATELSNAACRGYGSLFCPQPTPSMDGDHFVYVWVVCNRRLAGD